MSYQTINGKLYLELREVTINSDNTVSIENPDLDEYNLRLILADKYSKDKNSVGKCWLRAHCHRNGVVDLC